LDKKEDGLILVSACLAGLPCRYDGKAKGHPLVSGLLREKKALPVCPEQLGGLPTPRVPAEIFGGTGEDVLAGLARVITRDGRDVTAEYVRGAEAAADFALSAGITLAILQDRSPACGTTQIHDGSFSGALRPGLGVLAAALNRAGIDVRPAAHPGMQESEAESQE
jgi:uncharacterized protein YbbK (DUF523 family)